MNKRLLILMASMLLCGAVSAQAHFEADAHAHDNNMPVVAQVVLDGDVAVEETPIVSEVPDIMGEIMPDPGSIEEPEEGGDSK